MTPERAYDILENDPNLESKAIRGVFSRYRYRESLEHTIGSDAFWSYKYARNVIKGRWVPGEAAISKDAGYSFWYAEAVIKCRFVLGEAAISKDAEYAERYAKHFIKGRWELGEEAISKDAEYSHYYAKYVLKSRFILGEPAICKSSEWSFRYAVCAIRDWTPELAAMCPAWLYIYAKDVVKGRLPTVLHNKMIAFGIMDSSDKYVKKYLGSKKYCTLKGKDTKK